MKAVCPNSPDHKQFVTTAHIVEEWLVDETGSFIEVVNTGLEVSHGPDSGNIWTCVDCSAEAEVI